MSKADIFAFEPIFCRAGVASADHCFFFAELAARDQPHGAATGAGHDGYVWILRMAELGLVFEKENRSGVHFFWDPFFKELQVGRHPALRESDVFDVTDR